MLTPLHPDLWVCSVPYRILGLLVNRQLVVVRLPSGRLWVHSPIPWTTELRAELAGIGDVGHVVGPNLFHDECLKEFQAEYPQALFHATPGLAAARRDIRFVDVPLSDTPHPDWSGSLQQHLVRGMPRLNEVVFLHRASRSLLLADLAMNIRPPARFATQLAFRFAGTWNRFGPTRFFKSLIHDRAALRGSLDQILTWDFDRIIVGHGRNIESGGKAALSEAFAFVR
jgi:hypothetical protein